MKTTHYSYRLGSINGLYLCYAETLLGAKMEASKAMRERLHIKGVTGVTLYTNGVPTHQKSTKDREPWKTITNK